MCPYLNTRTLLANPIGYRAIIGSLQYLSLTRPDISYIVNKLSQFMQAPTDIHLNVVKRLLRFLHGTMRHGFSPLS